MDPYLIIKALNVAVLVIIGGALLVFWRTSDRQPFLLHWGLYEFAAAVAVIVSGHMLLGSLAVGAAVPVLLRGTFGYRKKRPLPLAAFLLMFAAIVLPAVGLATLVGKTSGLIYLSMAIAVGYLAAAALFFNEGSGLNLFIAAMFLGRAANILSYPLVAHYDVLYVCQTASQVLALAAGLGMLMAGFSKAYRGLKEREQELISAYNQSEELMLRLERRNEEYREARLNAEAANAAKTQFLANMSHELRTPLNAILGFSEALQVLPKDKAVERLDAYARNIHEAAGGLQSIINDILNLSRIEAGALEIQQETCDLSEIIAEILRLLQPLAGDKDIVLDNRADRPCLALCDRRLTKQALINGVSNAIKYTPRDGTVICSARTEGRRAVAIVEDTGIGIDEARLVKAFEPFWQEGNTFVAENTGVGLGLTIAKSYVEAQNGRIELARAANRGTIFRVYLPTATEATEAAD